MRVISCKKCGAKVSDQYSYCTNCQAPISAWALEAEYSDTSSSSRSMIGWLLSPLEGKRRPKHQIPTRTRQGAYVGAFVGLISGIITVSLLIIVSPLIKSAVSEYVAQQLPSALSVFPTLWNMVLAVAIVGVPIISAILGGGAGVLFVAFRDKIPGSSAIRKSVAFSFILLTLSLLAGLPSYFDPRWSSINSPAVATLLSLSLALRAFTFIEYPLLGFLFGYLLDRRLKPR